MILAIVNGCVLVAIGILRFLSKDKSTVRPWRTSPRRVNTAEGGGGAVTAAGARTSGYQRKRTEFGKIVTLEQFIVNLSTPVPRTLNLFALMFLLKSPNRHGVEVTASAANSEHRY